MIDPDAWRLSIHVYIRADLNGHALTRATAPGLGKINARPLNGQDHLAKRYIPRREHSQAKAAPANPIPPGRIPLIQRT